MKINNNTLGYIFILALLGVASLVSVNLFFQEKHSSDKLDINKFPHQINEWAGKDLTVTKQEYDILETKNLIYREYANPKGEQIYLFMIYSETNRSVFHPPEVCLIGDDIKIVNKNTEAINAEKGIMRANKLYVAKNNAKDIMLYSYKVGNVYTDNFYLQQALFAINQLLGRRVKGATIRVTMAVDAKGEEYTLASLREFLKETIRVVDGL